MTDDLGPRYDALLRELERRILVLDGAMGTMIQAHGLSEADYRGERLRDWTRELKGNHDLLNLTRPDVVEAVHREYLEAGADIVETNTFNGTRISLADYGLEALVHEMNVAAARAARAAVDGVMAAEPGRVCWVAGALGPTNKTASLSRDVNDPGARTVTFAELEAAYHEQARGLLDGGVDLLLVETVFDTLNAQGRPLRRSSRSSRSAGGAGRSWSRSRSPTAAAAPSPARRSRRSGTRSPTRRSSPSASTAPSARRRCGRYVEELSRIAPVFVSAYPNAGLPNAFGGFDETPESMAATCGEWARAGWLNIVGGCCGTTPAHIRRDRRGRAGPAAARAARRSSASRASPASSRFASAPTRTSSTSASGRTSPARRSSRSSSGPGSTTRPLAVARQQVEGGAQILDVNMDEGMLDSVAGDDDAS